MCLLKNRLSMSSKTPDTQSADSWPASEAEFSPGSGLAIHDALFQIGRPLFVHEVNGTRIIRQGTLFDSMPLFPESQDKNSLSAYVPSLLPESFGDPVFKKAHSLRYPLVAGAMANGITSTDIVREMGQAGMIGFFGAGGLTLPQIEAAIHRLQSVDGDVPYGFNLIHSPYDPALETATVDLYLQQGVRRVSAAAFLDLTLPLVRYRLTGIHRDETGMVVCPNQVIAKVSRTEVATKFLSPPPPKIVRALLDQGLISPDEAELAPFVPVADDLTAEADSGGHTDNRPALALLPTMLALRNELTRQYQYSRPICIGLGGGIATPAAAAAAFAMGAAYVLTGTINQSCVESGTCDTVRKMLSEAGQADVTMAPSADMFEMGVKVQVLKRGTMFPQRASKLYELYSNYNSLEELPPQQVQLLENSIFKKSLASEWEQTQAFFKERDPSQIARAEKDPHHRMGLVFRSYLGQSSLWAKNGVPDRVMDYQVWCGPSIGAFNEWVKGSFLEKPENRKVVTVSLNILAGAAVITRRGWLSSQGISLGPDDGQYKPLEMDKLQELLKC
jgi:PfaD family protein